MKLGKGGELVSDDAPDLTPAETILAVADDETFDAMFEAVDKAVFHRLYDIADDALRYAGAYDRIQGKRGDPAYDAKYRGVSFAAGDTLLKKVGERLLDGIDFVEIRDAVAAAVEETLERMAWSAVIKAENKLMDEIAAWAREAIAEVSAAVDNIEPVYADSGEQECAA